MFPKVGRNRRVDQLTAGLATRSVTALDPRLRALVILLLAGLAEVNDVDRRRQGMLRLATTSFLYLALCALIWLTDFDASDAKSTLEGVAAGAKPLVMPFALLLVAAHRQGGKHEGRDL